MAIQTTTFKGARYLVKFHDPIEWADTESYEAIEAVQYNAFTYISKQPVPAGVQIDNTDFWLLWADPNAQMEQLRQLVSQYVDDVETLSGVVGGLSDSLNQEIENRKIDIEKAHVFETVADMKQNANLSVGAICHTNGFHTSGDGGAAWYEITDTGTANEMDVIACGELFANVIVRNSVTPEMFGAYGDGIHDDSSIFNRVIEYVQSKIEQNSYAWNKNKTNFGYSIHLENKNYLLNNPINIIGTNTVTDSVSTKFNGIEIIGTSQNGTTLNFKYCQDDSIKILGGGFAIRNCKILNSSKAAIKTNETSLVPYITIENVLIYGGEIGIHVSHGCYLATFKQVYAIVTNTGFRFDGTITSTAVENCYATGNGLKYGFAFELINAENNMRFSAMYSSLKNCGCDSAEVAYYFDRTDVSLYSCAAEYASVAYIQCRYWCNINIDIFDFIGNSTAHELNFINIPGAGETVRNYVKIDCAMVRTRDENNTNPFINSESSFNTIVINRMNKYFDGNSLKDLYLSSKSTPSIFYKDTFAKILSGLNDWVDLFKVKNINGSVNSTIAGKIEVTAGINKQNIGTTFSMIVYLHKSFSPSFANADIVLKPEGYSADESANVNAPNLIFRLDENDILQVKHANPNFSATTTMGIQMSIENMMIESID